MAEVGRYECVRGFLFEKWPIGTVPRAAVQATRKGESLLYGVEIVPRVVSNPVLDSGQGEQSTNHSRVAAGNDKLVNILRVAVSLHKGFVVPTRTGGRGRRDSVRAVGRGKGRAGVIGQVLMQLLALSFKQGLDPGEAVGHSQGAGIFYSGYPNGF